MEIKKIISGLSLAVLFLLAILILLAASYIFLPSSRLTTEIAGIIAPVIFQFNWQILIVVAAIAYTFISLFNQKQIFPKTAQIILVAIFNVPLIYLVIIWVTKTWFGLFSVFLLVFSALLAALILAKLDFKKSAFAAILINTILAPLFIFLIFSVELGFIAFILIIITNASLIILLFVLGTLY
jgi:hypothetical protein